jgi:hypothetical protein
MNAIGLRQGTLVQHLTSLLKGLALVAFCIAAAIVAARMQRVAIPAHFRGRRRMVRPYRGVPADCRRLFRLEPADLFQ